MNFLSAVLTILSSFLITFLLMPSLIKYFRAKKEGQQIRKEGPTWHAKKAGTPTMGGLLFILCSSNNFMGCCLARVNYEYAVGTPLCPGCLWPDWDVG